MATLTLPKVSEFNPGFLARGSDVLANDQATANFLNAQNLDSNNINPAMTPTWTAVHIFNNGLKVYGGSDIILYSDAGTTTTLLMDGATGDVKIAPLGRLYLDSGVDTYIYQSANNIIRLVTGGTIRLTITDAQVATAAAVDFAVSSGRGLYLDGGGDTFLAESAANIMSFYVGTNERLRITNSTSVVAAIGSALSVDPTLKVYLDGGDDTYIFESSSNVMRLVVAGTSRLSILSSIILADSTVDFAISSTKAFYFDGGGNTYIRELTADKVEIVAGGVASAYFEAATVSLRTSIPIAASQTMGTSGSPWDAMYAASGTTNGFYLSGTAPWRMSSTNIGVGNKPLIFYSESPLGEVVRFASNGNGISTDTGSNFWDFAGYTAGAAGAITGYVTIAINGTTYKIQAVL